MSTSLKVARLAFVRTNAVECHRRISIRHGISQNRGRRVAAARCITSSTNCPRRPAVRKLGGDDTPSRFAAKSAKRARLRGAYRQGHLVSGPLGI